MRLTIAQLRAAFEYNPETGLFRWKQCRMRPAFVGQIAGCLHKPTGYVFLSLKNHKIKGHIAAWAMYHGRYPRFDLDHWDLDKTNNKIKNLRRANKSKNGANRLPQTNNTSGYKGVFRYWKNKNWFAQIRINGQTYYLGSFIDPADAAKAYDRKAVAHFGTYARTNAHMGLL